MKINNKINKQISNIFEILQQQNPNPTTELKYNSPFELLISVVLSAQSTDISVNKATETLFKHHNNPVAIINLGIDGLIEHIKTIGLYRTKAKHIIELCNILVYRYNSQVPDCFNDLILLPGVGRKTANVILNTIFKQPTIAVDTHIYRLSNRLGIASGSNVIEVEKKLTKVIPNEYKLNAHHWLILHGRYVCTARNPKCDNCIISQYCNYNLKNN